ncbi:MAG: flavin reductase family protein [Bacteroidetes bacterium]|nr:flavin reductase family protein [Bacteroidota bacterium]MCH8524117.1 flavin reductase family protein [Balneolales bacterium]
MEISPFQLDNMERYKLLIGSVVPRPIALVSSISAQGEPNLAPFSFFTVAAYNPMLLVFFPVRYKKKLEFKDTVINIRETAEFVINVVTEDIAEQANTCSGLYEKGANEFVISGLTAVKSRIVKPFRVKESPIQFECKLHKMLTISEESGGSDAIFGEVIHMHVDDSLIGDHKIDIRKLKPVAKLAGPEWSTIGEVINLDRPKV